MSKQKGMEGKNHTIETSCEIKPQCRIPSEPTDANIYLCWLTELMGPIKLATFYKL